MSEFIILGILSGILAGEVLYRNFQGDKLRVTAISCSIIVLGGAIFSKIMNLHHSEEIIMIAFITVMSMSVYLVAKIAWNLTNNSNNG